MKKIIIANWKANLGWRASQKLAENYRRLQLGQQTMLAVAPTELALSAVSEVLNGSAIQLAVQDIGWGAGAYTGELSPQTAEELKCHLALVGHSERRRHNGETCRLINQKILGVLQNSKSIKLVLCVGEDLAARKSGRFWSVISGQLRRGLAAVPDSGAKRLLIAYEPVWAIGSGRVADAVEVSEVHNQVRRWLMKRFGSGGRAVPILYGGSINADNAKELLNLDNVDGLLVGGASLSIQEIKKIANIK